MLEGPIKKFDTDFIIRHYITLSEAHAARKYVGRKFPEEEIRRGWHHKRLDLKESQLSVTANHALKYLATADTRIFDLSAPVKKHFWEW